MSLARRRFVPSFDRLEDRFVPAGNVTAKVIDDVLYIRGDDEANSISLVGNGSGGVTISSGSDATTINSNTGPFTLNGFRSINIKMKGGDDNLAINNLSLRRAIEIELGEGNDTLIMDRFHARRQSAIYGQAGDDTISISRSSFRKSLFLHAGAGDDTVTTTNAYFGRSTEIHGGSGTDARHYSNVSYGNNSWIFGFESTTNGSTPLAIDDAATVDQGADVTINVASNDLAMTGTLDLTSITITQNPAHGTVQVNNDGTVTYSNDGSTNTTDSFKYTIKNSSSKTSTVGTVTLTINPVNQAPIANNDSATVTKNGTKNIAVASNDSDAENRLDFTTITFTQLPTHGTVTLNNNGTVKYVHTGNDLTADSFKYTIKDLDGNVSNEATVNITVVNNTAPVANNDAATLAEGANSTINVATNDTDSDGTLDLTSIVITQQPTHGTVTVNNNGTVLYTHDGSNTTSDTFKYTIKDDNGASSNEATVTITITPVNDAPVANGDSGTIAEGGNTTIDLAANDTDSDGTIALNSIVITQQPLHGSINVNTNGTVTYTHDGSNSTTDSFKYTIKDNNGAVSNIANVSITITPVNDAPVANDDSSSIAVNGTKLINVAANDTDSDGTLDPTSIVITAQPAHGTLTVNNDGTISYVHDGSNSSTDNFKYTIKDNSGDTSNEATVRMAITQTNTAPVANDDTDSLSEGASKVINLTGNDTDTDGAIDPATIVITQQPAHGTLTVNNNGTVTYTHNGSDTTTDSFKYTVRDNLGTLSNVANVSLTINPVNDAPIAADDAATVDEGGNVLINLSNNDSDADGTLDLTSIVITQQPSHGTLTIHNDGTVTYTHDGSDTTSDSFKYTIKDNDGSTSNEATVNITVNPVNDAPVAVNDAGTVQNGGSTMINLAANDSDVDGNIDLTSIVITQQPAHGTVTINNDGTVTYTHDGSASLADVFAYLIKDNQGAPSNNAVVTITITA